MNHYYVYADLGEGIPSYDFVIKALSLESAKEKADKIVSDDYPDYGNVEIQVCEITAETLLERMTLDI